jgi:hypothetical protein
VTEQDLRTVSQRMGAVLAVVCGGLVLLPTAQRILRREVAEASWLTLALLGVAVLPWLLPFVSSFKAGTTGVELKLRDLEAKVDQNRQTLESMSADVKQTAQSAEVTRNAFVAGVGKLTRPAPSQSAVDPRVEVDDPHKHKFGDASRRSGRELTGEVTPLPGTDELFEVRLEVEATSGAKPLADGTIVNFYLHPTFRQPTVPVSVTGGRAVLARLAWGAFTVGAEISSEAVRLELDLAALDSAPPVFRAR